MSKKVKYCLAISEEQLGDNTPVLLQSGLEKAIIRASEMGFDSVELHIRDPRTLNAKKLLETANESNISIAAVGTGLEYTLNGLNLTSPDNSMRNKTAMRLKEHIDFAEQFNAVVFIGLCRGKAPNYTVREVYLNRLAEELAPIESYASKRGVILGFEPIAFYLTNLLNSTEETLEFLKRSGLETIQLLLDTHHMYIEDKDMDKSFRLCKGRIAHVHISDSNRLYPLSGNIDFSQVGFTLNDIGYEKAVSIEVLPYPSGEQAALKGLEWLKSVWGS